MDETLTRFNREIPASRRADSKDCSSFRSRPTPVVKNTSFGIIFLGIFVFIMEFTMGKLSDEFVKYIE